jgi:acyl carrier protein
MEAMSLAVEIEEAFGFAVLDEDLTEELFASFGALTDYIIKQSREDNA